MKLRISGDLALPADFITQTAAILAVRGAGKSNLAVVLAEQMYSAKLPFAVIDPTGTWVGLRSAGTGPGLGVVIFGGREGDVPLERGGGALVADLIAEERLSCVVDVSEFSEGDKVRFLTDFAKALYRRNRDPLHLFLEEADDYVPQQPGPKRAECLRAFQDIVRRGRARGLGITMVTQRSAVISKDVLTQIETLFVLRTTSPQDRKAIQGWVDYHGQSREVIDSLPGLKPGEAWVWSPHYLGTVKRIQIDRRTTLDSAATPKDVRGKRTPSTKADVDLQSVRERMAATVERAKAEDPKELRRRIAELEKELRAAVAAKPATVETVREVPALTAEERSLLEASATAIDRLRTDLSSLEGVAKVLRGDLAAVLERQAGAAAARQAAPGPRQRTAVAAPGPRRPRPAPPSHSDAHGALPKGQRAVLLALAQSGGTATGSKAALLAGYSVRSSTMRNIASALRTAGYADGSITAELRITPAGEAALGEWDPLPTGDELRQHWLAEMGGGAPRAILQALIDAYPRPLSREELGAASGYSADSSTLRNALSKLNTLGLITGRGDARRACEDLFQ